MAFKRPKAYAVWRLSGGHGKGATTEAVKLRGKLTTNDGMIAVNRALEGHGKLMHAEWDNERYLRDSRLVHVLPQYQTPDADIHAVCPQRHQLAARVRAFVVPNRRRRQTRRHPDPQRSGPRRGSGKRRLNRIRGIGVLGARAGTR